ncbi:PEP-CTERM sorting domain-containing protein [Nostoc sp. XA010]|uniref:PEP-CTERM sorting domain-containing protein n=1 Tax=Nostoc sp. XA010 TaxID=2780407 RepID=UPI001E457F86|nr:PEP-CTERM sorting domain-containing protein [Nostoc sp. XA010]MCC5656285.1 PEP-CTERM sorting domain-containing protein [Nostoc sp. XA010]
MKFVPQLVLAAASVALALVTVDAKSVSAAIINYAFTVDSPVNRGNGFFSFDDSTFSNEANPVAAIKSLSFQFDDDTIYTEQDDTKYPDFPLVFPATSSTGQTYFGLDYLFNDKSNPSSSISYEIIGEDFTAFSRTSPDGEPISGRVSYTQVPDSTPLIGALFAFSLGWMMKKKVKV